MHKGEGVTSYVSKIQNVKNELAVVGKKPTDNKLVRQLSMVSLRSGILSSKLFLGEICYLVGIIYGVTSLRRR